MDNSIRKNNSIHMQLNPQLQKKAEEMAIFYGIRVPELIRMIINYHYSNEYRVGRHGQQKGTDFGQSRPISDDGSEPVKTKKQIIADWTKFFNSRNYESMTTFLNEIAYLQFYIDQYQVKDTEFFVGVCEGKMGLTQRSPDVEFNILEMEDLNDDVLKFINSNFN